MNIQNVESCPEYIGNFLRTNMEQLINIYDAGKAANGDGCLSMVCSLNNNKMDVFYMNSEKLKDVTGLIYDNIKRYDKKVFLINDSDGYGNFLIYI